MVFASPEDVRARWDGAPDDDRRLAVLLADAAVWLLSTFPQIPDTPTGKLAHVLQMVSCSMVKRALVAADNDHLDSIAQSAGVFSQTRSFRNSEGNFYLTSQERTMIENALGSAGAMMSVESTGW